MGLLDSAMAGNLAAGLGGAYKGYVDADEREMKRQALLAQYAEKGLIKSDTGGWTLTPEEIQKRQGERDLINAQKDWYQTRSGVETDTTYKDLDQQRKATAEGLIYDPQARKFDQDPVTKRLNDAIAREAEAKAEKAGKFTPSQEALGGLYNTRAEIAKKQAETPKPIDPAALARANLLQAQQDEIRARMARDGMPKGPNPVNEARAGLLNAQTEAVKNKANAPVGSKGIDPLTQARIKNLDARTQAVQKKANEKKAGGQGLSKEGQLQINDLSKKNANKAAIYNSLSETYKQIANDKLPSAQRLAAANQSLKIMNSEMGADAVGAEESRRFGALLGFKPDLDAQKYRLGADIDGFAEQLKNMLSRNKDSIKTNEQVIESIRSGKPLSAGLLDTQVASANQKMVDLAKKAISSPTATPKQKANAQKYLESQGVK